MNCRLVIITILIFTLSCGNSKPFKSDKGSLLPSIPEHLKSTEERAEYLANHYWDNFSNADSASTEQYFVDFLSILPYVDNTNLDSAINKAVSTSHNHFFLDLTEKYLYNPDSPFRNDEYFIKFASGLINSGKYDNLATARLHFQLNLTKKNRINSKATDFKFIDRKGAKFSLNNIEASRILLLFFDPDCNHCNDVIQALSDNSNLQEYVVHNKITVVAIYAEGNLDAWNKHKDSLPLRWIVGIDNTGIIDKGLYNLKALPSLYLLDNDKKVILKDATPQDIIANLSIN